jgi:hypothetical protein
MDIDLARHAVRVAFRSTRALQELLPVLKQQCIDTEYKDYALGIAHAIDAVGAGLTNKILAAHPNLVKEIETDIAAHGRFI